LSLDQDDVTRAALVLFGADPARHVSGYRVQLVRRSGVHPTSVAASDRHVVSGPLAGVVEQVLGWIDTQTGAPEVVLGVRRERVPRFPTTAVREALLNALAHRDLTLDGATVDVVLWDDAIELRSPGGLPGHVTAESMRRERFSRNPRIMAVLKTMKLVEEFGEGVDRMFQAMEDRLLPLPIIIAEQSSVSVTLLDRSPLDLEDQVWLSMLAPLDLRPAERHALALTRRRGAIARRDLAAVRKDEAAGTVLSGLVAKGLLVRRGERGGATYSLSAEVVARAGAGGLQERQRQRDRLEAEARRAGSITSAEAADLLGEPVHVVREMLRDLVRAGRLTKTGRTRATRYVP